MYDLFRSETRHLRKARIPLMQGPCKFLDRPKKGIAGNSVDVLYAATSDILSKKNGDPKAAIIMG